VTPLARKRRPLGRRFHDSATKSFTTTTSTSKGAGGFVDRSADRSALALQIVFTVVAAILDGEPGTEGVVALLDELAEIGA